MDDIKYQIFISSTFSDLEPVRSKVSKTILNLQHFPIGMEMFSAGDSEQWEIITETIDVSDYYLLIIGHRYGSVTTEGISYTEKEFDYAVGKGIPVLSFIRERDIPTKAEERESDPVKIASLDAFIAKAKSNKMCEFWTSTDELATKVAVALPKTFKRMPRMGWVRAKEDNSLQILEELTTLSTENRVLREKLSKLESLVVKPSPSIKIQINNLDRVDLTCLADNAIHEITAPLPIRMRNIPSRLRPFITQENIDHHNKNIPDAASIQNYNIEYRRYMSAIKQASTLEFNITNSGSMKANEVTIFLSFPSFVQLINTSKIIKLEPPKNPLPFDVIASAEEKYRESLLPITVGSHLSYPGFVSSHGFRAMEHDLFTRNATSENYAHIMSNQEGELKLRLETLMHKLKISIDDDISLVPLSTGTGFISVDIICEEYTDMQGFEIPITVVSE